MKNVLPFIAVLAGIAVLAAWHGATGSSASRTALFLFPVLIALGSVWRVAARKT